MEAVGRFYISVFDIVYCSLLFLMTIKGLRQSDENWNWFKGNVGSTSERQDVPYRKHGGFSERIFN